MEPQVINQQTQLEPKTDFKKSIAILVLAWFIIFFQTSFFLFGVSEVKSIKDLPGIPFFLSYIFSLSIILTKKEKVYVYSIIALVTPFFLLAIKDRI